MKAARSLRAGHPLIGSFHLIAEEIADPVGTSFAEICQRQALGWQQPLAIGLGAILLLETAYIFITRSQRTALPSITTLLPDFGSPAAVGEILFNQYLLPVEVTSVLLLVAMIGAIVLTKSGED